MLFRRYVAGVAALLVWAEDEEAADITALIHASTMLPASLIDPPWLPFRSPMSEPE